ncbi:MAG: hypothetical protein NTY30_03975 [Candidatus Berkelbacteria bacterium]|nr:hypothetical protein [Candidatus Berkelbacteria bacterium]
MTAKQAAQLISNIKAARETISEMTPAQRKNLERSWDVEHAYYSSSLEGSNISRKEFNKIAEDVK